MIKISIIIPAYNVESSIKKCIMSVLASTYQNFEILVVDDGSTDHTAEIVEMIKNSDDRIFLIQKSNGGVSSARNKGLECATGEIIMFLDGDDLYHPEYCEMVIHHFEKDAPDIVMASYKELQGSTAKIVKCPVEETLDTKQRIFEELICNHFMNGVNGYIGSVCTGAFRKRIIDTCNIRFNLDVHHGEDKLFLIQYLLNSQKLSVIPDAMYDYVLKPSSVTRKYSPDLERNQAAFRKEWDNMMQKNGFNESDDQRGKSAVANVFSVVVNEARAGNPHSFIKQLNVVYKANLGLQNDIRRLKPDRPQLMIKRQIALHSLFCVAFFLLRRIQRYFGGTF